MTYLSIEDLQQMGVDLAALRPASTLLPAMDSIYLSPAMVRADIMLTNGAIIPGGTIVVTVSELNPNVPPASICFFPQKPLLPSSAEHQHPRDEAMCSVSYHLRNSGIISTGRVRESYLMLIYQGWNSAPPAVATSPPGTAPPQPLVAGSVAASPPQMPLPMPSQQQIPFLSGTGAPTGVTTRP